MLVPGAYIRADKNHSYMVTTMSLQTEMLMEAVRHPSPTLHLSLQPSGPSLTLKQVSNVRNDVKNVGFHHIFFPRMGGMVPTRECVNTKMAFQGRC